MAGLLSRTGTEGCMFCSILFSFLQGISSRCTFSILCIIFV